MNTPVQNLVIVGDGLIAWWAAAYLIKTVPGVKVTLVRTTIDATYVERPEEEFSSLLKSLGLSEQHILTYADGNMRAAQGYFNWAGNVDSYFHSTEIPQFTKDIIEFNQWLLKLRHAGSAEKVDDYLVRSVAARIGKVPFKEGADRFDAPISFDPHMFAELLKQGISQELSIVDGSVKKVNLDSNGFIQSISVHSDLIIEGDFFIDATGPSAALIGQALGVEYEPWSKSLPCNRKRTFISKPRSERLIPFSSIQLGSFGWVKNTPLRKKVISEFTYVDSVTQLQIESDSSTNAFCDSVETQFHPGMRKKTWSKNCLAIGDSAVVLEGFSHSSLFLAAVSLKFFVDLWPVVSRVLSVENEFNRLIRLEFEAIRDFHCLHYLLAKPSDSILSKLLTDIEVPSSLRSRLELFQTCGRTWMDDSTLIHPSQWTNLCVGMGLWPQSYDPLAKHDAIEEYIAWATHIKTGIYKTIDAIPDYTAYIKSNNFA